MITLENDGQFRLRKRYGSFDRFMTWDEVRQSGTREIRVPEYRVCTEYVQRDGTVTRHCTYYSLIKVAELTPERQMALCDEWGFTQNVFV